METLHRSALEPGSQLLWYRIERVLGQGSFGVTYLAQDRNLERRVAIKEYLPMGVAVRDEDGDVHSVSEDVDAQYRWGLDRFITEARTLAKCEHPNIVRVLNVFEEHNSAYMAMAYEEGESLSTVLERRGTLGEAELLGIVLPLLDGLEQVHRSGFIHRDIKPANIFIRTDGSPRLLDFGSARQALGTQFAGTLTVLYSPGYAPIEQYGKGDQQGPWSDIFSLGATLYRAVAGVTPTDVLERSQRSSEPVLLRPALEVGRGRYSDRFLKAIDHALSFRPGDRPRTVAEWRRELPDDKVLEVVSADVPTEAVVLQESRFAPGAQRVRRRVVYAGTALGVAVLGGALWLHWPGDSAAPIPPVNVPRAEDLFPLQSAEELFPLEPTATELQSPNKDPPPPSAYEKSIPSPRSPDGGTQRIEEQPALSGGEIGAGRRTGPQEAPAKYRPVPALEPERLQDQQRIESLLDRARRAMKREDWAEARSQLDRAAALQPQAVAALRVELGELTARQEKRSSPGPDPRSQPAASNEAPVREPKASKVVASSVGSNPAPERKRGREPRANTHAANECTELRMAFGLGEELSPEQLASLATACD